MSQASPGRAQPSGQAPETEERMPSCTPRGQFCFPYKRADAAGRRNSREGPGSRNIWAAAVCARTRDPAGAAWAVLPPLLPAAGLGLGGSRGGG